MYWISYLWGKYKRNSLKLFLNIRLLEYFVDFSYNIIVIVVLYNQYQLLIKRFLLALQRSEMLFLFLNISF